MTTIAPIKIAIVDDHTLFRNGISSLMTEFEEITVLFEAENGLQLQKKLRPEDLPQVVLMDISMPVMDGYAATSWLRDNYPQVSVLALSMFEDDKPVIGMIKCGACGYVLKETKPAELLTAIKTIREKGIYINELVSGKLVRSVAAQDTEQAPTLKELEFMKLCCSELTYKEIADKMFISPRTVDNYRDSIFEKFNLKSRTGIVLYAIKNGLFVV